jgi:anti-anti-sigma factor
MKTNRTAARAGVAAREGAGGAPRVPRRGTQAGASSGGRITSGGSRTPLASVQPWAHTLILTGELNARSAAELEAAMDGLFDEGVTGITLDLRLLDDIDATGAAVIAFRGGLCRRRGYDFAVIPASVEMQVALAEAGTIDLLPLSEGEPGGPRLSSLVLGSRARNRGGH